MLVVSKRVLSLNISFCIIFILDWHIPMSTNCAPLVADLFLFCYERDFLTTLSDVKQT